MLPAQHLTSLHHGINEEQSSAISKALSPSTITAILGPPGTGKTSVIAEIASQLATSGLRVLISSQSNLAVDNALERVKESDQIFRIRIGRPESVKFNADLLKERASDRYRDMLLEKSKRAFRELGSELDLVSVKTSDEDNRLVSEVQKFTQLRENQRQLSSRLALARDLQQQNKAHLDSCETLLSKALSDEELTEGDLPAFLKSVTALKRIAVNPTRVCEQWQEITFAPTRREGLRIVQDRIRAEEACEQRLTMADKRVNDLRSRISTSEEKEKELDRRLSQNISVDQKRRTSGLWGKIVSHLTDQIYDLDGLRKEIRSLDSLGAKALLPDELRSRGEAERALFEARNVRIEANQSLWGNSCELAEAKAKATELEIGLRTADALIEAGGLRFAKNMRSATTIVQACEKLRRAVEEERTSADTVKFVEASVGDVIRRLAEYLPSISDLGECCKSLNIALPLSLRNASDEVLLDVAAQFRATASNIRARKEKWPQIASALEAYHARLSEETVDLSRAAIAEANVVGATCSGIAGSADFADDFDWVIIDEAGRATPLDLLMPMVRGRSIVLVGDHKQLPPLLNPEVEKELVNDPDGTGVNGDYRLTLFERLFSGMPQIRKEALRKQYRMVDAICDVVREISYRELAIETTGAALTRKHPFKNLAPIHWIQCDGNKNRAETIGHGIRNWAEIEAIQQFLSRLIPISGSEEFLRFLQECKQGNPYEIGIIAMYRQQSLALESAILREQFPKDRLAIEVGTVDAFQGREKDAIIVSFVETNPNKLRFFYDRKRLNVALSRARELLVIVGGLDVLGRKAKVLVEGRSINNPLNELKFLFDGCLAANHATRETYHAE